MASMPESLNPTIDNILGNLQVQWRDRNYHIGFNHFSMCGRSYFENDVPSLPPVAYLEPCCAHCVTGLLALIKIHDYWLISDDLPPAPP